jgi:hypothetical protein
MTFWRGTPPGLEALPQEIRHLRMRMLFGTPLFDFRQLTKGNGVLCPFANTVSYAQILLSDDL